MKFVVFGLAAFMLSGCGGENTLTAATRAATPARDDSLGSLAVSIVEVGGTCIRGRST